MEMKCKMKNGNYESSKNINWRLHYQLNKSRPSLQRKNNKRKSKQERRGKFTENEKRLQIHGQRKKLLDGGVTSNRMGNIGKFSLAAHTAIIPRYHTGKVCKYVEFLVFQNH